MKTVADLSVKIFADGAELSGMVALYRQPYIRGFTTNPMLMHKAGMPAFASCLANQQPGSWAGAFRLREGTVVTVVRDDLIVPDGDQFFSDETEARDRLLQEIGFGGLQRIYAPEAWAIKEIDACDNIPNIAVTFLRSFPRHSYESIHRMPRTKLH